MRKVESLLRDGIVEQWCHRELPQVPLAFKLKPMQRAVIACNRYNDVLVNLPTGFGKSMLYQYQALIPNSQCIIVIVPLKALLWDSIVEARQLGISADQLNPENMANFNVNNPQKLLFVTPERLYQNYQAYETVVKLAKLNKLGLFVIDEAHCVCQWGNDFRKDYSKLSSLREDFPNIRILSLTATAPPLIRNEIAQKLKLKNAYFFFASYNRPNLIYDVIKTTKSSLTRNIEDLINKDFRNQSGIIYCQTIKLCQQLHNELKYTLNCEVFHSNVPAGKRERVLNQFKNLPNKIIIATICFGMGINKLDVRFVIHAGISFSIENYYQESGRAGRDGKSARCILFSYPQQENTLLFLLDRTKRQYQTNTKILHNRKVQLDVMLKYALTRIECRKRYMYRIMGEDFPNCGKYCDICFNGGKFEQYDFTENGVKILNAMINANAILTPTQLKHILRGKTCRQKKYQDALKPITGLLKRTKEEQIMEIIQEMIVENYFSTLLKKNEFTVVKRILVNKRKKFDKITFTRPANRIQVIQKKIVTFDEYVKEIKRVQQLDRQKQLLLRKDYGDNIQPNPYVPIELLQQDYVCQEGKAIKPSQYEGMLNQLPPTEQISERKSIILDISCDQDEQGEGEQQQKIGNYVNQHDIHTMMPQIELILKEPQEGFTEEFLLSKAGRKEPKEIGCEGEVVKSKNAKQNQGKYEQVINNQKIQQQIADKEAESEGKRKKVISDILTKYGIEEKPLKRETPMETKTQISAEMEKERLKKLKQRKKLFKFI